MLLVLLGMLPATASSMLLGVLVLVLLGVLPATASSILPGIPRILLGHWCLLYEMEKQYNRHTPNIGFVSRPT